MGGSQSKQFFQALKDVNQEKAIELYQSSEELKRLDPNKPYGLFHRSVTPLHLSAKLGFLDLFKLFMTRGGRADHLDGRKQTVVHHICRTFSGNDSLVDQNRAEMLIFLIDVCTAPEKVCPDKSLARQLLNLNRQDKALNTPLHLAAGSGLYRCTQILLSHGAVVSLTNIAGQTPFMVAETMGHTEIVKILEPKMVFTNTSDAALIVQKPTTLRLESYVGVEKDDIHKMKTEIIELTATVLDIPILAAQQLLQHYSWSQQLLVDAWLDDPTKVCETAKVKLPMGRQTSLMAEAITLRQSSREDHICEICGDICVELIHNACHHAFCKICWEEYLRSKVTEGKVVKIPCPGFGCEDYITQELVVKLLPSELNTKFTHFDIGAFIESHPYTRWCPYPGCDRAVHLKVPSSDNNTQVKPEEATPSDTPRNVDCGAGHFFCWSCSEEAHDPCSCETWKIWKSKIASLDGSKESVDALSQKSSSESWVAKFSKPCPKCKRPIQRSDGCNHMTCSVCSHDFCWACLGRWAIHGSRTGGYYRCNRFKAVKRAEDHLDALQKLANVESQKKNTRYFKHVYSRYTNHTQSLEFERSYLMSVSEKVKSVVEAVTAAGLCQHIKDEDKEGKFAKEAIRELIKSRIALRASYALSYYVDSDSNRDGFVKLIAPLEKATEVLAEMIARPHLSTPKDHIILATIESRSARREFLMKSRSFNIRLLEVPSFEDPEDDNLLSDHDDSDIDSDWSDDESPLSSPYPDSGPYSPHSSPDEISLNVHPLNPRAGNRYINRTIPTELEIHLEESDDDYYWDH